MLKKTGRTPRSYAKNIKNNEGVLYLCPECDMVIRGYTEEPKKCPYCNVVIEEACTVKILEKRDEDAKTKDKHS
jgi:rubrerythrin